MLCNEEGPTVFFLRQSIFFAGLSRLLTAALYRYEDTATSNKMLAISQAAYRVPQSGPLDEILQREGSRCCRIAFGFVFDLAILFWAPIAGKLEDMHMGSYESPRRIHQCSIFQRIWSQGLEGYGFSHLGASIKSSHSGSCV